MISHPYTTPNGAQGSFHVLKKAQLFEPFDHLICDVDCYFSQATYEAGGGILYRENYSVPLLTLSGNLLAHAEEWLVSNPESALFGGSIVTDTSDGLDAVKARAWASVKIARTMAETGNFEFEGNIYQADQGKIMGAVILAMLAKMNNAPYEEGWTLTNNDVVKLNADQVIGLGIAVGKYVSKVYSEGRITREQIYAATSIEELKELGWVA